MSGQVGMMDGCRGTMLTTHDASGMILNENRDKSKPKVNNGTMAVRSVGGTKWLLLLLYPERRCRETPEEYSGPQTGPGFGKPPRRQLRTS